MEDLAGRFQSSEQRIARLLDGNEIDRPPGREAEPIERPPVVARRQTEYREVDVGVPLELVAGQRTEEGHPAGVKLLDQNPHQLGKARPRLLRPPRACLAQRLIAEAHRPQVGAEIHAAIVGMARRWRKLPGVTARSLYVSGS